MSLSHEVPMTFPHVPEVFLPVLIAIVSAWVLWSFTRNKRSVVWLIVVLALDLVLWGQSSGWYVLSNKSTDDVWHTPEVISVLRKAAPKQPFVYRILTVPHTFNPDTPPIPPSVSHSTDWTLWTQPDIYMLFGVQNAAGYDGFGVERYSKLAGDMKLWGELSDPDRTLRSESREIDVLNVRYLISIRKVDDKDLTPKAKSDRWTLLTRTTYADIYENGRALPRAWQATAALVMNEDAILKVIRSGRLPDGSLWDPAKTALVERQTNLPANSLVSDARTQILRYEPNRVSLSTEAKEESILVLSDTAYPGWRVYVDGEPAELLRVNYDLRGVVVPIGEHGVTFIYQPWSVMIGFLVSLFTGLGLVIVLLKARIAGLYARIP